MAIQLTDEELNAIDAKYSYGNSMRAVANMANQMTQSHALQVYRASLSSGYAPDLVATNLPAYKENEFDKVDWEKVMTASPKTYEFLANPMRMAAMGTVKNINSLASIENEWKVTTAVKNSFKDLARGMLGSGIGAIESARLTANENNQVESGFSTNKAANVLTGITSNTLSAVVTPVLKKARDSELLQSKEVKGDTWLGQLGLDVTQQTGQLAMQLAAAYFSRGATLPTLLTGAYTAGGDYNELTKEGVETRRAWQAGVMDAAAQAPFERIGIGKMMKKTPAGGSMAKEIMEKALTEGITEFFQKYPEAITQIWAKNPNMTAQERTDEFVKNFWEITKEGAYEGLIGVILGGAGGAVSLSVQRQVLNKTITNMENQQHVLAGMDIDPAIKKEMLDNIVDGQKIYIEPKALLTLYQDGFLSQDELDNLLGIDSQTVAANANKGQLVEVPLANYQVAASQHPEIHQALKDDIATDEDGYTPRGLKVRNERDIKKYGEKAKQQRDEVKAAADEVMQEWVASGAISQEKAQAVMTALISHARAYSSNPAQFIREKAPLFVKGTNTMAGAMEQPPNSDVDPDRKVTAVDITTTLPATIVTNNDLLSHIKGLVGNSGVISTADNKAIVDILPKDVRHIVYSSRKVSNTQLTVRKGSILSITDLLANAVLIESVPNTKTGTKPNVNVYHRFYVPVQFKDKVYTVRLVAEEQHGAITLDPTAVNLYDVIVESKKPLLTNQPTSGGSSGLASANGSFVTTIREMLTSVKDAGGVKYFQHAGQNKKPPVSPEDVGPSGTTLSERSFTEGAEASLNNNIPQPGELFQSQNNPRGSIHWDEEGRAIITMFQNADASTVIHELVGHYFIQNLLDEGAKDTAPDWMKQDRTKALEWAASQDVKQELTKLLASAERQNKPEDAARFRDALAFVEAGGQTMDAATNSDHDHHQALRTAYHELLARAAEAYILEGKAPSVETRSLFRRFTEWLVEIYQDIKALGVTLNPEIRGVFDRMLATEEEMTRMVEFEGYLQQLPQDFYNNLSERHKAEVDKLLANVEAKAKEQVRAHLMREFTDQNERLIQEEEQAALERITAEVKAMPRYQAEAVIEERFGRKAKSVAQSYVGHQASPFGATSAAETIAIKRKLLERMIETGDEQGIANLQQEIDALVQKEAAKKANQLQAAEQTEFEFIAEIMHGFTSGDHLAQELIAYNDSETSIRNRLDEHMTAFKKQLTDEEALHQSVEEAMYSDEGALLIAAEQRIIDELLGKMIEKDNARLEALRLQEVSRQAAATEVAGMPLDKVMNLRVWISAERRAAESAQKALAKGDLQTAREQKAIQLFNHHMVQESLKARREFERVTNFLKRQKKSGRDTWMSDEISADGTRSATDRHFIQGADLLRRLGFGRSDYTPEENRETFAHYADKMVDENPDMVNLPEWLTKRPDDKINLRSLRIDQLKDIEGALRNIKQMAKAGRDMNSFTTLNGNGVEATALALIDTAAPLPDALVDKIEKEQVSGKEKFLAGLQRPDQLFLKLDHMKEDGPWSRAFYAALSAAQNVKSNLQRQVYEAIDSAYTAAGVSREERQSNAHRQIYIAEWDQSVRKNTLLAMLLNMGSQSNKERLFQSRPVGLDINHEADWNEPALRAVLTKYLEPKDFQLAQGIWDAIDLLYQPYNTMVRLMTGRPLEKVEALPLSFTMPDGTTIYLRGGYYPLKQDTRATMQAELNAEKSVMKNFVGMMPYANAGASKSRVAGAKYAVDFDLSNLWRHITDVTHDIAFRPVMHDINKLLRHDGVRETLRHKLGQGNYDVIIDWYRAIATAKDATVDNLLNQFMTFARTATTIKNLLFRPATLVQNLANFSLYGNAVRGFSERNSLEAYLKYGWGEYIPHALSNSAKAKEIRAWVYAKSPMMRDKMESPDYTVRDIKETGFDNRLMDSPNETLYKVGATIAFSQEKVVEFGSTMLAWMDQLTDIPIFRGAYFQAIAQGKSEQEAIRFAESVISRTTGSGRKIDTSLMQRGSTSEKLMTMFLTFLNTQYNRWAMEARIFLSEKDYWRLIQFVGIKYLAFGMLSAVFSGKLPDTEDENGWLKWFFKEVVMWPMGMIPVGGPLVKVVLDTAIGNKSFGYSITPAEQNLEEIIKLASTAKRYTEGKVQTPELLERGSGVASFFLRYPDQLNDWFWNAYDIISGTMDPEARDLLRRRPRKER